MPKKIRWLNRCSYYRKYVSIKELVLFIQVCLWLIRLLCYPVVVEFPPSLTCSCWQAGGVPRRGWRVAGEFLILHRGACYKKYDNCFNLLAVK